MSPISLVLVRHFVSGDAFFTGIVCLMLAVAWRHFRWPGGERVVWLLAIAGGLCFLFSASSMLNGGSLISEIVTLGWLILGRPPADSTAPPAEPHLTRPRKKSADSLLSAVIVLLWAFEGGVEWQWRRLPVLSPESRQAPVLILGDSITAGVGEKEAVTWPNRLREQTHREIIDLSQMGATVGSTLKNLPESFPDKPLVVIELGGNDLLGTTSTGRFQLQLEELLGKVTPLAVETVMFELPLPPLSNGYGQVQRRLARKYRVKLIPKRILADVLISPETTLDSLHLNQSGHDRLAQVMREILEE